MNKPLYILIFFSISFWAKREKVSETGLFADDADVGSLSEPSLPIHSSVESTEKALLGGSFADTIFMLSEWFTFWLGFCIGSASISLIAKIQNYF